MNKINILGYDEEIGFYELKDNKKSMYEMQRGGNEFAMRFSAVSRHTRWLRGEILTIIEAVIQDPRVLEATKTIVKDKFDAKLSWLYEICGLPEDEGLEGTSKGTNSK